MPADSPTPASPVGGAPTGLSVQERWAELHRRGNASRTKEEAKAIMAEMDDLLASPALPGFADCACDGVGMCRDHIRDMLDHLPPTTPENECA